MVFGRVKAAERGRADFGGRRTRRLEGVVLVFPPTLSRRALLHAASAAVATTVLVPSIKPPLAWGQETGGATSLAATIAGSLAKGALGSVGSFAFGQMMSAIGFDMSGQAEMNAKLDQILGKLDALQSSVDHLHDYLSSELTQMQYDQAYAQVQPLISQNKHLNEKFKYLLTASKENVKKTKIEIAFAIENTTYQSGIETWHDVLTGANGQTSLIRAGSRAVFNKQSIFNRRQAQIIQQYWEYFDAQQALTVSYLVDLLNATNRRDEAGTLISQWYTNRDAQLAKIRGCVAPVDLFPKIRGTAVVEQRTALNALPQGTLYSKATSLMWCTESFGPMPGKLIPWSSWSKLNGNFDSLVQKFVPGRSGWGIPNSDTTKNLLIECGFEQAGVNALIAQGFAMNNANVRVLAGCTYVHADPLDVADCSSWGSNESGQLFILAARRLQSDDQFFYT
jgi:hypothetical protein